MLLLFLVNSVARQNFVGKTNAQPIFTTTTTGPMFVQDVARIIGMPLVQGHMILLGWGGPTVGQGQAEKRGVVDKTFEGHGQSFKDRKPRNTISLLSRAPVFSHGLTFLYKGEESLFPSLLPGSSARPNN